MAPAIHSVSRLMKSAPDTKFLFPNYERPDSIPLAAGGAADLLEHLHDHRLVRPFEVQKQAAPARHSGERGIAFFEYLLQVPANRWGNSVYSATQLKIIQEVITLAVFCGFAILYLGEKIRWNHLAAFVCILAAVAFTFLPKD
jgi:hypothetical protein